MGTLLGTLPGLVKTGAGEPAGIPLPDERELIRRVQGGDTAAFGTLVEGYVRRARAIAFRLMQNLDDADDLVQDTFLRALQRIDSVDPERPFGPWFFRVLTNTGLDAIRRRKTRQTDAADPEAPAPGPTPEQEAEQGEVRRRFNVALEELPPRQRTIVWSFEVDGMSTKEIARELGVAEVTVRWHLLQGRRALRAALANLRD